MLRHLLYPFLPYRSFLLPILVLSAIAVPCWLVFRLYRLRTRRAALSFQREILLLIFVVYLSGLAAAHARPQPSSRSVAEATVAIELHPNLASLTCSSAILPRGSTAQGFCVRNARGNLLLFIPLGILLPLVWRRLRFWSGIQIAIALSVQHRAPPVPLEGMGELSNGRRQRCHPERSGGGSWPGTRVSAAVAPGQSSRGSARLTFAARRRAEAAGQSGEQSPSWRCLDEAIALCLERFPPHPDACTPRTSSFGSRPSCAPSSKGRRGMDPPSSSCCAT